MSFATRNTQTKWATAGMIIVSGIQDYGALVAKPRHTGESLNLLCCGICTLLGQPTAHTQFFSNSTCQKAHCKVHKKECKMHRIVYDMEHKGTEETEKLQADQGTHCTGCGVEFGEEYVVDQDCPDCGYLTCESCSCSYSKGVFDILPIKYRALFRQTGSCYCNDSNFGNAYCSQGTSSSWQEIYSI